MGDEARNTGGRAGWASTSFRAQAISFVSAGPLKREEDAWNTVSEDDSPQKPPGAESAPDLPKSPEQELHAVESPLRPQAEPFLPRTDEPAPVEATPEVNVLSTSHEKSERATSINGLASPASDSEEEIVFFGRGGTGRQPSRNPTPTPARQKKPEPPSVREEAETATTPAAAAVHHPTSTTKEQIVTSSTSLGLDSPATLPSSTPAQCKRNKRLPFGRKYGEDELLQDYIDNMALDDSEIEEPNVSTGQGTSRKPFKKTETYRMFKGDGLENAKVQTKGKKKRPSHLPDQAIDWDSDDLADFDDLSTTDGEIDNVGQVIRHRTRVSGAQYLVVADGAEASDAKWMLHSHMTSESATNEIRIYEEIRQLTIEEEDLDDEDDDDDDSDEDEDEEALQDLIDNIDSEDDENARILKYTSRMTDEQIARALAKQEELGLGSDELVLFDGDAPDSGDMDDVLGAGEDFVSFSLSKHTSNRGRSKRNKKQRDSFPSAEAFADALDQDPYGAFDVMDFERPSLKPKKKGRKSDFPWDLGELDEDIKDQLVNSWTKDREKKAERKRQKEEARLTASLDAADGGDPAIIKSRIRQFLVQDTDTLKLSPMAADIRASVHRLAKALKLNSRSEGKEGFGIGRYPVLTKTPRTPYYSIDTIWEIDALMNTRKFFYGNMSGRSNKVPRTPGPARARRTGGGGIMAGASYRDGEEVGASAPELGSDNKGRAMLEKMGWISGTGIGAEGNKGSIDHVRHIVKTTKAGLG